MTRQLLGFVALMTAFVACGSSDSARFKPPEDGGVLGSGGDTGSGGSAAVGGSDNSSGRGGALPGTCPSLSVSTAPLDCQQDFSHAKVAFPTRCRAAAGGYQATCRAYDATGTVGPRGTTWCFYATSTGNLAGSFVDEGSGDCKSFDLDFEKPDVSTCAPASGGDCAPDAG